MHILVLTDRPGGGASLLPSLDYLGHEVADIPLTTTTLTGMGSTDVVLVDATEDLHEATAACRQVSVHDLAAPILVIISEAALAALKPTWGFDDWVLPTASPAELETRLRLVGARVARGPVDEHSHAVGDLTVDEESYQVKLRGAPLDLTFKEFELLKTLASHPNRVFTRELLLQEVWGYDYFGGSRTVDVHIRRLRAKLGPEYEGLIVTVRGVGYKLVPLADRKRDVGSDSDSD